MVYSQHFRAQPRFKCAAPVLILGGRPLKFSHARICNFSEEGLCFEISSPLDTGDYIVVKTDDSSIIERIGSGSGKIRPAVIKWCVKKEVNGLRHYGCGAQYVSARHRILE